MDVNGVVHLRGGVKDGVIGLGTQIFTLPVGFRPTRLVAFAGVSGTAFGIVQIQPTGAVEVVTGVNTSVLMDGIQFRVD